MRINNLSFKQFETPTLGIEEGSTIIQAEPPPVDKPQDQVVSAESFLRLKLEVERIIPQNNLLVSHQIQENIFVELLNNTFPAMSSDRTFQELDKLLADLLYKDREDLVDNLIIRNKHVRSDLRLYAFGFRAQHISSNNQAIYNLAQELNPVARADLKEKNCNDDINKVIDYAIGDSFPQHIVKEYCLASLILMHNSSQAEFERRGITNIGFILPQDYLLNRASYIMNYANAFVATSADASNNGTHELEFHFSAKDREGTIDFIGKSFHELTHGELDIQYEAKIDDRGEYKDINKDSVSEFVCDLANLVNIYESVDKDEDYFFRTAERLKYKDAYKKVHCEDEADGHYNSRAILYSIFEDTKQLKGKLDLAEFLKELYYSSFIVIEKYRKQGKQNNIKFDDFIKDLIIATKNYLREKNLKIEILGCKEQYACFDSSNVPIIHICSINN